MRDRRRNRRRWDLRSEDDPLSGLVNLFDLWMVFSIALLIVFAGSLKKRSDSSSAGMTPPVAPKEARSLERFRISRDELKSSGEKLGTAYRLPSGEVVCVPDAGH